jgi:hypothetical protein
MPCRARVLYPSAAGLAAMDGRSGHRETQNLGRLASRGVPSLAFPASPDPANGHGKCGLGRNPR